jgi:hypothetical protein
MTKKTKAEFIEALVTKFPEIKDEVLDEDYDNLVSLQVGCFRRYTQKAIDANDRPTTLKCFHFADNCIDMVEFEVENSLAISWAAKLKFDSHDDLYSLFPAKLKQIRTELLEAYDAIKQKQMPHKAKKYKNKKR